jgi:signal transduction histidine kinase
MVLAINLKYMKLLSKINRKFVLFSIPVLLISTIPVYFIVLTIQENEITEGLRATDSWVTGSIIAGKEIPALYPVIEVKKCGEMKAEMVKDTLIFDPNENDFELFRELISVKAIQGAFYHITVRSYGLEKRNLALLLFLIFLSVIIILNATLVFINHRVSRSVWRPLGETIDWIQNFSLKQQSHVILAESDIDEFRSLNLEISRLMARILSDYQNIKQFSENAAHELQTPLAIIRNKVDLLLASQGLSDEQITIAASVEESIDRLNRLNRGLLLLSKIENRQYTQSQEINLKTVISEVMAEFVEIFEMKSVAFEFFSGDDRSIFMDPDLARILFNNLLNNAIKYTSAGGKVIIAADNTEIRISNSGTMAVSGGDRVFNRFYRENPSGNSTGLGLALVRSICEASSMQVGYEFSNQSHHFVLTKVAPY